jgi:hypothetical protein
MFRRSNLLALCGMTALIAGLLVFGVGRDFSTNWARWFFGPLLWFIGFAMLTGWGVQVVCRLAQKQDEQDKKRMSNAAAQRQ